MSDFTNFNGYSHGDMRRMVQSMDSGGVMSASDPWRKAAATLKQIRTALNTASGDATSSWEGATSDAFYSKMTKLANSVNNVAAYANDAAVTLQMMSEAIDQAKHDMPEEPDFLDKVGDAISDTAKSAVGVDNEDTRTTVADAKKAQAVAVMETLAAKYRAGSANLKPPRPGIDDPTDIPPPDSSGAEAISGLFVGAGMGLAGAAGNTGDAQSSPRSSSSRSGHSPESPRPVAVAPTDPGIRGGTANPAPHAPSPGNVGPGTGIDGGVTMPKAGGVGGGPLAPGGGGGATGTSGIPGGGGFSGVVGGGLGGGGLAGGAKAGASGGRGASGRSALGAEGGGSAVRGGGAFGAGGMRGADGGVGGAAGGARPGQGLGKRSGGAAGEAGSGGAGRRSFTEGGSGIGRSRAQAGQTGPGGAGHGMPGGGKAGKKDKKKGGERPDYLVEDAETWVSEEKANPNVVE
ncbi:WXG100 family type VII secretion target [Kitasatospora sp. GP82]|uniref:WXG100 family type VII secretion target n=1 Tax=Kitasatospora sp. GP82 TaxID=3035089 RepID=UPI002474AE01|nr:WXG100 family type VII secretion target [Kitasatospora sp. GP82]MDH6126656.1 uncharacterized protein YukE [Kitasatospora sp. GP82]